MADNSADAQWSLAGTIESQLEEMDVSAQDRQTVYSHYAEQAYRAYLSTNVLQCVEDAIQLGRREIAYSKQEDSNFAGRLKNLGIFLEKRFKRLGRLEDLEEAIAASRQAVKATPEDSIDRAGRLSNLGNKLECRFERLGQLADLEEAIAISRQAVKATPDSIDLARWLNNLGNKLERRFGRLGQLADLEEAIAVSRQAVKATPEDSIYLAGRLSNLGNKLEYRFERLGQLADLEEAIVVCRQAMKVTPEDSIDLAGRLSNLGNKLERRFERLGQLADLKEAIAISRQAVKATLEDSIELARWRNNLGNKLERRFGRLGQLADLEEAIIVSRQAVKATPEDSIDLAGRLINLGNKLERRFKRLGQLADLEEAIAISRQAVKATPEDSIDLAGRLSNLGNKLERRFERLGQLADLEEAIAVSRQAVKVTPEDSVDLATLLSNLGNKLERRFEHLQLHEDDVEATAVYCKAWGMTNAIPIVRLRVAKKCVTRLRAQSEHSEAIAIAAEALGLLPALSTRALSYQDRQHIVAEFSGLASDACALRLGWKSENLHDVEQALLLLEAGRGSLLGLAFEDRVDLAALQTSHPQHVARLHDLRAMLNTYTSADVVSLHQNSQRPSPFRILTDFRAHIDEIRLLPSFARFMMPPSIDEMRVAATGGTIVIVNVSVIRSDAIIVTEQGIRSVVLQEMTESETRRWLTDIRGWPSPAQDLSQAGKQNKHYRRFLRWLWKTCVHRIINELGYGLQRNVEALPHIHWIGTGLASALPFHAAGKHVDDSMSATLHMAVSSYVPSVRALIHARNRAGKHSGDQRKHRLLLTIMTTTPGAPDLQGTAAEARAIKGIFGNTNHVTHLNQPSADTVLQLMANHDMFHFAGHGECHPTNPAYSSLVFEKLDSQSSSLVQDPLVVQKLFEMDLQPARLAFLSACSTAENKDDQLLDESLHIGSGFLVAGYQHVIACLWPSNDEVCVGVAREFYHQLSKSSEHGMTDRAFALALHVSICKAYASRREEPLSWAPYVHIGA